VKTFPRLDILPPEQRRLWPELARVGEEAFVLYGGAYMKQRLVAAAAGVKSIPDVRVKSKELSVRHREKL
jgi:hypothetical protein